MKDIETFTDVYKRYAALIIKSVVAQTNDEELANEICQNVFMSYYRHMERIETDFVKAWLLHAARNQMIDYWKRASTRKELLAEQKPEGLMEKEDCCNVEKICSDRTFICEIMKDLKAENEIWYEVIECICIRQMTSEEACEYLGIPPDVLRSRLHRARCYLHKMYDKEL